MKAVIVAGGKGTRIAAVASEIPKPLVPIGSTPLLEHQINLLKQSDITEVIIITGHLGHCIHNYFNNGSAWGVPVTCFQEPVPLGTTGGIKEIEGSLTDDFLVLFGDVMINMDIDRFITFHLQKRSLCTLAVHPNDHPYDSDLVDMDQTGRITAFYPKPHDRNKWYRNLVNAGMFIMSPSVLQHIPKGVKADFGRDIFPKLPSIIPLYGYNTAEYMKDVGTPQRLSEVNEDWASGKIKRMHRRWQRPAVFLDRDGVINKEVDLLHRASDFELLPGVADAVRSINLTEYLAVVVTNQPVIARNLCSIEELNTIHNTMETLLGRQRAKLDGIYYCPHHPDSGYPEENPEYKIPCRCRKPGTGLIEQAAEDFNIDLSSSFIIGDSERDIRCGQNAGLTTIGLKTGKACKNSAVEPDHFFNDLSEAVAFIINKKI